MAYNPLVPTAVMDAMLNQIGGDAAGGFLVIYTGEQPVRGGALNSDNTLLVSLSLGSPAFYAASSGQLAAYPISSANAAAGGVPTWFRIYKWDGVTAIVDGSAGVGPQFVLNLTLPGGSIIVGQQVVVNSFVLYQPTNNPEVNLGLGVSNNMLLQIGIPANGGYLRIYSGTQPSTGGGTIPGGDVLLAQLRLANPAFSTPTNGSMSVNPIPVAAAIAAGVPSWFRMLESDGSTVLLDGSAGEGQYDLLIVPQLTVGQQVQISAFTIAQS